MPTDGIAHVHLDPVGGIAGDMFTAALCHARPDLEPGLVAALRGVGLPDDARVGLADDRRGGIAGRRFSVEVEQDGPHSGTFAAIRDRLRASALDVAVRERAIAILTVLAEAEGRIHGVPVDAVHFHELADWDSVADMAAAAWLIEALGRPSWSVASLPLGGGRVRTAHGSLPVPAPATALLLEGLPVHDDGIGGERVTPTGAAILRHLAPRPLVPGRSLRLVATGHGLGRREIQGLPNMLRALLLAEGDAEAVAAERIGVIRFEVDDQTAEDLALGLDRVRALAEVLDVCQWPAIGKRGRLGTAVQVLCRPDALERTALRLPRRDQHHRPQAPRGGPARPRPRVRGGDGRRCPGRGEIGSPTGRRQDGEGRDGLARGRGRRLCDARPAAAPQRGSDARGRAVSGDLEALGTVFREIGGAVAIAASGGVDSMTLAVVAGRTLGARALVYHAVSPAVPPEATDRVRRWAGREGWRLEVILAGELDDPDYRANPVDRCYFCKRDLYGTIRRHTEAPIVSGTNLDDLGDFRPGLKAAAQHGVRHPFVECGIDKARVRALARSLALDDLAELPAAPCLASRIETGLPVTAARLGLVLEAERLVERTVGPGTLRCRVLPAGLRIELEPRLLEALDPPARATLAAAIDGLQRRLGHAGPVELAAYRRGSAFRHASAGER